MSSGLNWFASITWARLSYTSLTVCRLNAVALPSELASGDRIARTLFSNANETHFGWNKLCFTTESQSGHGAYD